MVARAFLCPHPFVPFFEALDMRAKDISNLSLKANMALFLDFDGTLAPLCDDAASVSISEEQADLLVDVSKVLDGALAIISGRDLRDLAPRVPHELWRSGNHGLFVASPSSIIPTDFPALPQALSSELGDLIQPMEDVWLETKGPVAAIHFRAAPQHEEAVLEGVDEILSRFSDYKRQHGNMIVEAKPIKANKGNFLRQQMRQRGFSGRTPVMIGDDTTDEDAFSVAQELGGIAVKVGDGDSCALYRAPKISNVYTFLRTAL